MKRDFGEDLKAEEILPFVEKVVNDFIKTASREALARGLIASSTNKSHRTFANTLSVEIVKELKKVGILTWSQLKENYKSIPFHVGVFGAVALVEALKHQDPDFLETAGQNTD